MCLATVKAWLCAIDFIVNGASGDAEGVPASKLCDVLQFADAVGSSPGVLSVLVRHDVLKRLYFTAQESPFARINPDSGLYYLVGLDTPQGNMWSLRRSTPSMYAEVLGRNKVVCPRTLVDSVAAQAEQLLFLAHKLRLQPLIDKMHKFLFWCLAPEKGLLRDRVNDVLSDRILDEVLADSTLDRADYEATILRQPCDFFISPQEPGLLRLLEVPNQVKASSRGFKIKAELQRDFCGDAKGTRVDVQLTLYGCNEKIRPAIEIGHVKLPVQLVMGPTSKALAATSVAKPLLTFSDNSDDLSD